MWTLTLSPIRAWAISDPSIRRMVLSVVGKRQRPRPWAAPVKARHPRERGVQDLRGGVDSRFRGNDERRRWQPWSSTRADHVLNLARLVRVREEIQLWIA